MARVRRKAGARTRWNLEIAGLLALGFALLLGIALVAPPGRTGIAGSATAHALHAAFGAGAGPFVLLVALVAAIVFLEINVPRMIATLGGAACAYFVAADVALSAAGRDGGMLGGALHAALRALIGDAGTWIVLIVGVLAVTVAITGVSLKKVIGWGVTRLAALRPPAEPRPKNGKALAPAPGPTSLREAFHLPALLPRARPAAAGAPSSGAASVATEMPSPTHTVVSEPVRFFDLEAHDEDDGLDVADDDQLDTDEDLDDDEIEDEDDFDEDDEALEDDDLDDDELDDDDAELDDEEPSEDDESAGEPEEDELDDVESGVADAVSGDYEPALPRPAYRLPDVAAIFDPPQAQKYDDATRGHVLEDTLASFGVGAKVVHTERGPSITRYELKPDRGVKISRISSLADDLALALAATSVRIEAPIPGKSAVGIEVPNTTVSIVAIREILDHVPRGGAPLQMALGKDITGRPVYGDLGKMPHLLVAGATGAGKSVCLNCIIASLLVTSTPDQLELLMIDPKRVELTVYNGIPHLKNEVITDPSLAAGALAMITREMDQRYERFAKAGVRKIEEFNAKVPDDKLPYIVVVIDELADLMLVAPAKVEMLIMRLAQLARATGIHLVVATQRPSVDVITGLIKANIPSRIAFAVSSQVDSRTILDMGGAERLLGRGDMLYLPIDAPKPIRAQGALVTGAEIERLVEFWRAQAKPDDARAMEIVPIREDDDRNGNGDRKVDPLWYDVAKTLLDARVARGDANVGSIAELQRIFSIGHPRAMRIMRQLEEFGIVGPNEGTKPRAVILESPADLERIADRIGRPAQTDLFAP
ncbi:MAG TPA: DNA translocase FtsK [Candidatus Baltobacteraceae bacterium]|nr:DNA translocase FtsK [Candidatus Baltobacteraceae bacterium]